jgi:hypothetical protein
MRLIIALPASDPVAAESVNWTGARILFMGSKATAALTLQLRGCGTSLLSPEALRSHLCDKNKVRGRIKRARRCAQCFSGGEVAF